MSDWGILQKIKADREGQAVELAKEKQKSDKNKYKKYLDSLIFLKQLEKEEAKQKKIEENKEIQKNLQKIQNLKIIEKKSDIEKKNQYIETIETHKTLQKKTKEQEKLKKLIEDKKFLEFIKEKSEKEDQKAQEKKDFLYRQQQEIKKTVEIQEKIKQQQRENEKKLEQKLLEDQKILEEKRLKEKKDFFDMLNKKQQQNTKNFNYEVLKANQNKDFFLHQWEVKGMKELEKNSSKQEELQVKKRMQAKTLNQEMMKEYFQTKETERFRMENEKKIELEENIKRQNEIRKSETEGRLKELEKKRIYGMELIQQNERIKNLRAIPEFMNEAELKLNKEFLLNKKPGLQLGGSIIGSPKPSNSLKIQNFSKSPTYRGASSIIFG